MSENKGGTHGYVSVYLNPLHCFFPGVDFRFHGGKLVFYFQICFFFLQKRQHKPFLVPFSSFFCCFSCFSRVFHHLKCERFKTLLPFLPCQLTPRRVLRSWIKVKRCYGQNNQFFSKLVLTFSPRFSVGVDFVIRIKIPYFHFSPLRGSFDFFTTICKFPENLKTFIKNS